MEDRIDIFLIFNTKFFLSVSDNPYDVDLIDRNSLNLFLSRQYLFCIDIRHSKEEKITEAQFFVDISGRKVSTSAVHELRTLLLGHSLTVTHKPEKLLEFLRDTR